VTGFMLIYFRHKSVVVKQIRMWKAHSIGYTNITFGSVHFIKYDMHHISGTGSTLRPVTVVILRHFVFLLSGA